MTEERRKGEEGRFGRERERGRGVRGREPRGRGTPFRAGEGILWPQRGGVRGKTATVRGAEWRSGAWTK